MTHKIKVQMFGNFRMDYNGAPFVTVEKRAIYGQIYFIIAQERRL